MKRALWQQQRRIVEARLARFPGPTGPDDRIGVVAFDDQVDLVLPLARHDGDQAGWQRPDLHVHAG